MAQVVPDSETDRGRLLLKNEIIAFLVTSSPFSRIDAPAASLLAKSEWLICFVPREVVSTSKS